MTSTHAARASRRVAGAPFQVKAPRLPPIVRRHALLAVVLLGTALRAGVLLERPFLAEDGPGYLWLAQEGIQPAQWKSALAGYFPPLYPVAIRIAHASGLGRRLWG